MRELDASLLLNFFTTASSSKPTNTLSCPGRGPGCGFKILNSGVMTPRTFFSALAFSSAPCWKSWSPHQSSTMPRYSPPFGAAGAIVMRREKLLLFGALTITCKEPLSQRELSPSAALFMESPCSSAAPSVGRAGPSTTTNSRSSGRVNNHMILCLSVPCSSLSLLRCPGDGRQLEAVEQRERRAHPKELQPPQQQEQIRHRAAQPVLERRVAVEAGLAWAAVRQLLYVATKRKYSGASVSAVTRRRLSEYTGFARRELSRRPFPAWSSAGITCSTFSK